MKFKLSEPVDDEVVEILLEIARTAITARDARLAHEIMVSARVYDPVGLEPTREQLAADRESYLHMHRTRAAHLAALDRVTL